MWRSFFEELHKIAKVKTPLLPHQQRVVDRMSDPDQSGLIVAHGLGSGKTLTSIAVQDALGVPGTVVAPAALLANYRKEQLRHLGGNAKNVSLHSMQNVARKGLPPTSGLLVVDEAHRLRNPGSTRNAVTDTNAEKRLLLTGSPFYNHPSDIAPLLNLAANRRVVPGDATGFSQRYLKDVTTRPGFFARLGGATPSTETHLNSARAKELSDVFKKYVDYHPGTSENFPSVTYEDVPVPMSKRQLEVYDTVLGQAPRWVRNKIQSGMPPSKQEASQLNAFMSGVRQVSNTHAPFQAEPEAGASPKIQRAFEEMQKHLAASPRAKAVVYSNYLDAGIKPYKALLDQAKVPYGEFTGEMTAKQRDELVRQYNDNKLKALLLSSAGGEGLDLKGTRLLQVLEPHWNDEKLKQVEGRGARFGSHALLPAEERKLHVQRFLATHPEGMLEKLKLRSPKKGVDEYLQGMSERKKNLIDEFRALLPRQPEKSSS